MKPISHFSRLLFLLIPLLYLNTSMAQKLEIKPPVAKKIPKELTNHNDTRIDNYYWLNQREDEEVLEYLRAENEYKDAALEHTKDLQTQLYDEIVGRIKKEDESVPFKKNGYYYLVKYEEGNEYPIYTRKKDNLEAPEEVLLDVNVLAEPYEFYNVSGRQVSPDNKILAYGEDTLSRRQYTIRFKNLETGKMYEDKIPNTTGWMVWANDNKTVFYTKKDESLRAYKIFKHVLGTDAADDQLVYHEEDATYNVYVSKSKSEKYLIIGSYSTLATEMRVLSADNPNGTFEVFQTRPEAGVKHEYWISHYEDKWYILTDWEAENSRLMVTDETKMTKENWAEVIPHRKDVLLKGMDIFKDYLVLSERINGVRTIRVIPWDKSQKEHYIDFGEDSYVAYTSTNLEFDTDVLRIGYTSLTTPNSTFDYDMGKKEKTLLKQEPVLGDFKSENYVSERIYAKAKDGTKIPISLVYKKGFQKDGKAPLLIYGYGSYGASMNPTFSSTRLSLLDRGFCFAIAHIRGGQEMGRHWYENGKMLHKKNTFTDFIDCSEYLIEQKYTNKDQLFALGGSAGGLLMGAIINMRPDLYKGVIAKVPFVDVVTTMLDESIPLTTGEYDEWGNPNNKEYYDYIKSYSPYDNVKAQDYPHLLVTTGLHDSQVQYWEPAKWVAKLRELKTDDNLLLLQTDMEVGHGGKSGRFARYVDTAREYAFLLDLANIKE